MFLASKSIDTLHYRPLFFSHPGGSEKKHWPKKAENNSIQNCDEKKHSYHLTLKNPSLVQQNIRKHRGPGGPHYPWVKHLPLDQETTCCPTFWTLRVRTPWMKIALGTCKVVVEILPRRKRKSFWVPKDFSGQNWNRLNRRFLKKITVYHQVILMRIHPTISTFGGNVDGLLPIICL